jgi:hypothetical protein
MAPLATVAHGHRLHGHRTPAISPTARCAHLASGEVIDLGAKRVRHIATPHVAAHGWDAGLLFEETTGTLFCGDLFSAVGACVPLTSDDIVGLPPQKTCSSPRASRRLRRPRPRVACRPGAAAVGADAGPSFDGDAVGALVSLAGVYRERHDAA